MEQNKQDVLLYAFRYALGRRTYAVATMAEEIIYRHKNKELTPKTISVILRDIREARERDALGDDCDIELWADVELVLSL